MSMGHIISNNLLRIIFQKWPWKSLRQSIKQQIVSVKVHPKGSLLGYYRYLFLESKISLVKTWLLLIPKESTTMLTCCPSKKRRKKLSEPPTYLTSTRTHSEKTRSEWIIATVALSASLVIRGLQLKTAHLYHPSTIKIGARAKILRVNTSIRTRPHWTILAAVCTDETLGCLTERNNWH